MKEWDEQGCSYCRTNLHLIPKLGMNYDRHSILYKCPKCGAFWEMNEKFAFEISPSDVKAFYPDVIIEKR